MDGARSLRRDHKNSVSLSSLVLGLNSGRALGHVESGHIAFNTRSTRGSPAAIADGLLSLDLLEFGQGDLDGTATRITAFHRRLAHIGGVGEELLGGGQLIVVGSNR